MLNKNYLLFFALFWTSTVTYLSLSTIDSQLGNEIHIKNKDKIVHFVFYFLFVFLWSLYANFKKNIPNSSSKILFIAILYGIMMEIFQGVFTTNRTADVFDVVANSLGAFGGYISIKRYLKNKTL